MSFRTRVIVNPAAAAGATRRRWPELQRALARVLSSWEVEFTSGPDHATELAREAVEKGIQMIVCVGGDGTMNEIVTGLFEASSEGISDSLVRSDVV
ncbi:MAG: acylglycerol kinase family protein, partial [Myxococcota bacterium]